MPFTPKQEPPRKLTELADLLRTHYNHPWCFQDGTVQYSLALRRLSEAEIEGRDYTKDVPPPAVPGVREDAPFEDRFNLKEVQRLFEEDRKKLGTHDRLVNVSLPGGLPEGETREKLVERIRAMEEALKKYQAENRPAMNAKVAGIIHLAVEGGIPADAATSQRPTPNVQEATADEQALRASSTATGMSPLLAARGADKARANWLQQNLPFSVRSALYSYILDLSNNDQGVYDLSGFFTPGS